MSYIVSYQEQLDPTWRHKWRPETTLRSARSLARSLNVAPDRFSHVTVSLVREGYFAPPKRPAV